jgi:hypothetical protein
MRTVWSRGRGTTWLIGGLAVTIGCLFPILPAPARLPLALAVTLLVVERVLMMPREG